MCLPVTPYRVEREWTHAGLACAVTQAEEGRHRCGYVRVPPTHPAFGKGYDLLDVSVHGGLTFAQREPCSEHQDGQGWWFGFDCAHAGDAMLDPSHVSTNPEFLALKRIFGENPGFMRWKDHYWTQEEVEQECNDLAEQLAAMGNRDATQTV